MNKLKFAQNNLNFTQEQIDSVYDGLIATDQDTRNGDRYYKSKKTGEGHWCRGLDDTMYFFGGVPDYQI